MSNTERMKNGILHNIGMVVLVFLMVSYTGISVTQYTADDNFSITSSSDDYFTGLRTGDYFSFDRVVCIDKDVVVEVSREIINFDSQQSYMLPNVNYVATGNDYKKCNEMTFITYVPEILEPGDYYYNPTLFYNVNPLKTVTRSAPGVYFEVIEKQ